MNKYFYHDGWETDIRQMEKKRLLSMVVLKSQSWPFSDDVATIWNPQPDIGYKKDTPKEKWKGKENRVKNVQRVEGSLYLPTC